MIENLQLLDRIGETYSNKLIDEVQSEFLENLLKRFPDYFGKVNNGIINYAKTASVVTVLDPKETEIKSIGMSCINDLLTNNFGIFLGQFFSGDSTNRSWRNTSNAAKNVKVYGTQTQLFNITNNGGVGTRIAIGGGSTPAARDNFDIEGPEFGKVDTGNGGYNPALGKISIPGVLTGTSNNTITETGLFANWIPTAAGPSQFLLSHDNISPGVAVLIGQTINVDYTILLS